MKQLERNLKSIFASLPKNAVEKSEEKKIMAIARYTLIALHANA